jgi:hypothetical protein
MFQFKQIKRGPDAKAPGLGERIVYSSGSEYGGDEDGGSDEEYLDLDDNEILNGLDLSSENGEMGSDVEKDEIEFGKDVDTLDTKKDILQMI